MSHNQPNFPVDDGPVDDGVVFDGGPPRGRRTDRHDEVDDGGRLLDRHPRGGARSPSPTPTTGTSASSWFHDAPSAVAFHLGLFGWQQRWILSAPTVTTPAAPLDSPTRFRAHLFVTRYFSIPITFSDLVPVDWEREAEDRRAGLKKGWATEKAAWIVAGLIGIALSITGLVLFKRDFHEHALRNLMTWHHCPAGHGCIVEGPTKFWVKSVSVWFATMTTHWVNSVPPLVAEQRSLSFSEPMGTFGYINYELFTVKDKTIAVNFDVPLDASTAVIFEYYGGEGSIRFNLTELAENNQKSVEFTPANTESSTIVIQSGWSMPSSKNLTLTMSGVMRDYAKNATLRDCVASHQPFPMPGAPTRRGECEIASTRIPSFSRYTFLADPLGSAYEQVNLKLELRVAPFVVVYVLLSLLLLISTAVAVLAAFGDWTVGSWMRERRKRRRRAERRSGGGNGGSGAAALATTTSAGGGGRAARTVPEEQQSLLVRVDDD
ncbi:hypothetical protein DFJ73DRAFT_369736 [Zopfochytrium polystomum]|nr:hypothetical protein DFJ73DRAFT_369736 [Zopfochytrium polystomum]